MTLSQNGWAANRRDLVSSRTVPGTRVRLTVRNGAAGDLLLEVAALFDLLVQDVDGVADDWGYAERPIRGSTATSNHASGTAIDLNATCWSLGSAASVYLTAKQITRVREIVAATGGVVRWGGDYTGRKDPMHFEINDGQAEADCARALAALRAHYGTGPTSAVGTSTAKPLAPAPPRPREDDPMAIIPIRVDDHGRFHETCMVEAGGGSRYGAQASITFGSTWGATRVTLTVLDHQGHVVGRWPEYNLGNNEFAGADLPATSRILTVEGYVQFPADEVDEAGNVTRLATRFAAGVHTKAA